MICLISKQSQKNSRKNGNWPLAFDYAIWSVLESKTNAPPHSNVGLLKTAIGKEWNKMSDEYILKACKSFLMSVCTIIEKMVATLSKFKTDYSQQKQY